MSRLLALKKQRAEACDSMEAILAGADPAGLTPEDADRLKALQAKDDALQESIKIEEDVERRRASAAVPIQSLPGASESGSVYASPAEKLEPGTRFARITQALAANRMDQRAAADWAEKAWGTADGQIIAGLEQSTLESGGYLVRENYSADFLDLLRPRVAVRRLGCKVIPLPGGNLTTDQKTGGTSAGYIGETDPIPVTGLTVGQLNMSAKKMGALVPISNQLLRRASRDTEAMVRDDLQSAVAIGEDQQFLRGAGSALSPTGLRYLSTNNIAWSGTATLTAVSRFLASLVLRPTLANVPMVSPGWILSPTVETFLSELRDGNGNIAFPEMSQGLLKRYPYVSTTSVPDNLGVGGNESEITFADFAQVAIGDTLHLTIAASTEATYHDGTQLQSAFQRDLTLVRIIQEHDLGLRYQDAVAIGTGINWQLA